MKKKPKQPLIAYDNPQRMIATEYGVIRYEDWCKKEVARIGGKALLVYCDGLIGVKG